MLATRSESLEIQMTKSRARMLIVAFATMGLNMFTMQAVFAQSTGGARALIEEAANALGGVDRVRSVKNITLYGNGLWAYQFGMANVTASPNAAMREMAANDLRRVYDLDHDRFQQKERRNMMFSFALLAQTNWEPINQVLDGDVPYNIDLEGKQTRIARWTGTAWHLDGIHMRRMWEMNNPVVAVRAALDPATKLSNERTEEGLRWVDVTLKEGDKFSLAFNEQTHLPARVRWSNPHNNFGELTFTTYLEGYAPISGILLPMSYVTKTDWRNIEYFKVFVDNYEVDSKIDDLSADWATRLAPQAEYDADLTSPIHPIKIANGVWYLQFFGQATIAFEFADHITLYELHRKPMAEALIEAARHIAPGKPVTQLITSHAHSDHLAGIRVAVAEGLTIISRRGNEGIIRDMVTHPSPDYPDILSKHPQPLKFMPVDEHLRLSDSTLTVDVYWDRMNPHMADGLFAYVPSAKAFVEADLATAARTYQYWPDNFEDDIDYYKLDVDKLLPVHFGTPMSKAEAIEFIRGGVERARARCAEEVAKGNVHIGCPVISHRY
jgi:glyoxylase-like metal-dependent hydrolase (beta-lactamase superfamily II)